MSDLSVAHEMDHWSLYVAVFVFALTVAACDSMFLCAWKVLKGYHI